MWELVILGGFGGLIILGWLVVFCGFWFFGRFLGFWGFGGFCSLRGLDGLVGLGGFWSVVLGWVGMILFLLIWKKMLGLSWLRLIL